MKHLSTDAGSTPRHTSTTARSRSMTPESDQNAPTGKQRTGKAIGAEVTTPKESVNLAAEFGVKFSEATDLWIVRGKTGQVRLAEKSVIAVCLLNKAAQYPSGDADKVRATLKTYRSAWRKLTTEKKDEWMNKAQKVFTPARKEYHATIKPLAQSAVNDKRFTLERFAVSCTKGGIVHVANRATYRPA